MRSHLMSIFKTAADADEDGKTFLTKSFPVLCHSTQCSEPSLSTVIAKKDKNVCSCESLLSKVALN